MPTRLAPAAVLALCAAALLAACGGGGGGDSAAASAAPAAKAASAANGISNGNANGNANANSAATATCSLPDFQATAMARINQWRASGATCGARGVFASAPALAWSDRLTQAGEVHSVDMVAGNYFAHAGSDGSSVGTRTTAAGYAWRTVGENIAAG